MPGVEQHRQSLTFGFTKMPPKFFTAGDVSPTLKTNIVSKVSWRGGLYIRAAYWLSAADALTRTDIGGDECRSWPDTL